MGLILVKEIDYLPKYIEHLAVIIIYIFIIAIVVVVTEILARESTLSKSIFAPFMLYECFFSKYGDIQIFRCFPLGS